MFSYARPTMFNILLVIIILILLRNMHQCTEPVNKAGDTPLSLAFKGGHWEVVKYLAITHHCDAKSKLIYFKFANLLVLLYNACIGYTACTVQCMKYLHGA